MRFLELLSLGLVLLGVFFFFYTYFGYPVILTVLARLKGKRPSEPPSFASHWPTLSISVPVFNEENQIGGLLHSLLALDYPKERLQILIVSDGSTDRTNEIVESFVPDGIELLSLPERGGKTRAETAAAERLKGEIVVNTDASIRIDPSALKPLIEKFADPAVGLASGRDVSVAAGGERTNVGETGYVGYEMWIRDLETSVKGIVGASGCFYAIRSDLHRAPLPGDLSRDFAAALVAIENGYRSVSVPEAVCYVPRTTSLRREYRRKVRTIARGMKTLAYKRRLLSPARTGIYAWMLLSHKVLRWALPYFGIAAFLGLCVLARNQPWALASLGGCLAFLALAGTGWLFADRARMPRVFSVPAFILAGNLAAAHAFFRFLRNAPTAMWEPTRRNAIDGP